MPGQAQSELLPAKGGAGMLLSQAWVSWGGNRDTGREQGLPTRLTFQGGWSWAAGGSRGADRG